jgi:hypothetical protein
MMGRQTTFSRQERHRMPPAEDRNDRERQKAIEMAVGQIEKQFG